MIDSDPQRPAGWIPAGAKLVQLRDGRKQPATSQGHLAGVLSSEFVALGRNVGIVLDEHLLAIDLDKPHLPEAAKLIARLTADGLHGATWQQRTPRQHASEIERRRAPHGTHWLFRTPPGWRGTNAKLVIDGVQVGEIKTLGYIVAPGSEIICDDGEKRAYELACALPPLPAPQWALKLTQMAPAASQVPGIERHAVPDGERDNELIAYAGFMRYRGDSAERIYENLRALVDAGFIEQPPGREVEDSDLRRIARSAGRYAAGQRVPEVLPTGWQCLTEVEIVREPLRWWIRDFVPRGELVMLYGKGGIGKSSWGSWLAAEVTKRNGTFAFVGLEEPFHRFGARALLGGAKRELLFGLADAASLQLPKTIPTLEDEIRQAGYSVLYLDSINSHFEHLQGLNAAERDRTVLGPLAALAQRTGCTIIGVFHEKKESDLYLGSTEKINVARCVLRATRTAGGDLYLGVEKTNGRDPKRRMRFSMGSHRLIDTSSGETQLEEGENGRLVPLTLGVLSRQADVETDSIAVEDLAPDGPRRRRRGASIST